MTVILLIRRLITMTSVKQSGGRKKDMMKISNYAAACIFMMSGCMLDSDMWVGALAMVIVSGLWLTASGIRGGYLT